MTIMNDVKENTFKVQTNKDELATEINTKNEDDKVDQNLPNKVLEIGKGIKNENKKLFDLFSFNIIEDPSINSDLEMAFDFPKSYQELVLDVDDETYYNHFI